MSWIVGAIGSIQDKDRALLNRFSENSVFSHSTNKLVIFAGGTANTIFDIKSQSSKSLLISGVGFKKLDNNVKVMNATDWNKINIQQSLEIIDGHFVHLQYDENEIIITTDKLGLRDIFVAKTSEDTYFFSTRLDWLNKFLKSTIDFKRFGSRWLLQNQISHESFVKGVHRICAGTTLQINISKSIYKTNKLKINNTNSLAKFTSSDLEAGLSSFANLSVPIDHTRMLCLSGGFDSRVVLSLLLKSGLNDFETVTFGERESPDSQVANDLAKFFNIKHQNISTPISDIDSFIALLDEYSNQTLVNSAASTFAHLLNFHQIDTKKVIIDGGFGEIWRRGFAQKLFLFARKAINNKDPRIVFKYLLYGRGDFFAPEIINEMTMGCYDEILEYLDRNPFNKEFGYGNYVDQFAINTRLVNYYGPEQTYLDTRYLSCMPFAQNSLLTNLYSHSMRERIGGSALKKIIHRNSPKLENFPLAKNDFTYSYKYSTLHLNFIKYKSKNIGNKQDKPPSSQLFSLLKPYLLDILSTKTVTENPIYNKQKIQEMQRHLADGNLSGGIMNDIDWFMSFNLFYKNFI